ncbi:cyclohexanone monooxygenase [Capronia epimyces CBS 606.96]|uniref:Cyclohexanone monooxygenase n=1 Tax=Capronia epimyces CBS 606.96 TaxID=1182542 RepID=W9YPY4_9EURO|nr:cyclohexanone monooxygenase [Capronia epimyces CBS 606.96]EXJ84314.1 cyclohexanone monooxygenase [Capronia epimyces CBS 606.96]
MAQPHFDALVVGAGFGGIYQLHKLLQQGLSVKVIDAAGDVGGTWYWNRYPGAMSDTESYIYRYSWDKDDLINYPWKEHYLKQPDVLAYLEHVVDRYDLRKHMQFNTELQQAQYDEANNVWLVQCSTGDTFTARYVVTGLGLLSKTNYPNIPGIEKFQGELYHTGNWPRTHDFKDKRVGIVGNGSTGVQVITAIAKEVRQLVSFQRTPQYSVPSGDGPVSKEYRDSINSRYDEIWEQVRNSVVAFGFEESKIPAMSVSAEEREEKFQEAWRRGNGFRFMFWTFSDLTVDEEANEEACRFVRKKIGQIVQDPEKARKLTPHDFYARRPLCDAGYYEQFNRPNVDIVSLKENPIKGITENGVAMSDGTQYDLDVLIFATGFDAVDGNYTRIAIKGRNGQSLKDHWDKTGGPTTYLGVCVSGFPNLFMITGPNGPFTNIPPTIETQVEFIAATIATAEEHGRAKNHASNGVANSNSAAAPSNSSAFGPVIEALQSAEDNWTQVCKEISHNSLFRKTDSWVFGANVPGRKHTVLFYFGGLGAYRKVLREVVDSGYQGFKPL